jgi:hypothetical protein
MNENYIYYIKVYSDLILTLTIPILYILSLIAYISMCTVIFEYKLTNDTDCIILLIIGLITQLYKMFICIRFYYRVKLVFMLINTPFIYCLIYPKDFFDNKLYIRILLTCITNYLYAIISFFKRYNKDELEELILNNDERIRKENLRLVKEDVNKYMINDLTNIVIEYYNTYIVDESYENIV